MNAPAEPRRRTKRRYKMKQLVESTGLPRQAIHFYIQEGLLPPGTKTGKNMAYYGDEHLERLETIRRLQHERFLPLKVIKAVLDGREGAYSKEQREFLSELRVELGERIAEPRPPASAVDAEPLLAQLGLDVEDLERAVELGILTMVLGEDGTRRVPTSQVWLLEHLATLRRTGFTRELGFTIDEIAFFDEQMDALVRMEIDLLFRKIRHLPTETVARLVERGMPQVSALLARLHETKIRELFGAIA